MKIFLRCVIIYVALCLLVAIAVRCIAYESMYVCVKEGVCIVTKSILFGCSFGAIVYFCLWSFSKDE